jgi:hypothetical protein
MAWELQVAVFKNAVDFGLERGVTEVLVLAAVSRTKLGQDDEECAGRDLSEYQARPEIGWGEV